MLHYQNQNFKDYQELFKFYKLYSLNYVMKKTCTGINLIMRVIKKLNIKCEEITLVPSGKVHRLYTAEDVQKIINGLNIDYKNDVVPVNYISKKELALWLGIKETTLNQMQIYFKDFNDYAKYFFENNVKKKYFIFDDNSKKYFIEKKNIYITPYSVRRNKKIYENNNSDVIREREYIENYRHHKIAFDYEMFNRLFNTHSIWFNELIHIYKKYAKLQVADSSIMDCHHIIPRFMSDYKFLSDTENTIYLTKEIHLLVHILEFHCALPEYKSKFFGSFALLTSRIDSSKINENAFNEVIKGLIKTLDIY